MTIVMCVVSSRFNMAAKGAKSMTLQVIHGPKKYDVKLALPSHEAGDALCVTHLSAAVFECTEIPPEAQRLIYKGKSLQNQSEELLRLGLKEGAKVMLVGKKPVPQDDEATRALTDVETRLEKETSKLSDITYELDGIHRGFLEKSKQAEVVKQKEKQMGLLTEHLMRMLEQLDTLRFEESNKGGRGKRKTLVDKIQTLLNRIDGLSRGLSEIKEKLCDAR